MSMIVEQAEGRKATHKFVTENLGGGLERKAIVTRVTDGKGNVDGKSAISWEQNTASGGESVLVQGTVSYHDDGAAKAADWLAEQGWSVRAGDRDDGGEVYSADILQTIYDGQIANTSVNKPQINKLSRVTDDEVRRRCSERSYANELLAHLDMRSDKAGERERSRSKNTTSDAALKEARSWSVNERAINLTEWHASRQQSYELQASDRGFADWCLSNGLPSVHHRDPRKNIANSRQADWLISLEHDQQSDLLDKISKQRGDQSAALAAVMAVLKEDDEVTIKRFTDSTYDTSSWGEWLGSLVSGQGKGASGQ